MEATLPDPAPSPPEPDPLEQAQKMVRVHRSQHLRKLNDRNADVSELKEIVRLEVELDTMERVARLREATRQYV